MQHGDIKDMGDFFEVGLGRDVQKDIGKGRVLNRLFSRFGRNVNLEILIREANLSSVNQEIQIQLYVDSINANSRECHIEKIVSRGNTYYRMDNVERPWGTYG